MQRVKIVWKNGADTQEHFDPPNPTEMWDTIKAKVDRYDYAVAGWYEAYFNEATGDQSEWELCAEFRGLMMR